MAHDGANITPRSSTNMLIALLVLAGLALSLSNAPVAASDPAPGVTPSPKTGLDLFRGPDHPIHLKSREFTPPAGLPAVERSLLAAQSADAAGGRLHVLLQFDQHPDAAQRAQLARQGVRLLTYLPDYAWYASVPAGLVSSGKLPPGARWMGALRPDDRLALELQQVSLAAGEPLRLYLIVHPDVTMDAATAAVTSLGGTVLGLAPEFQRLHVEVPAGSLPALAASDLWYWITREPPPRRRLNDGSRAATRTDQAQAAGYHGNPPGAPNSIVLAVWDGGWVANSHSAFTGRLTIADAGSSTDEHATHVAGTMAGSGANSPSGRDLRGHADRAVVISYDWYDSDTEHRPAISTYGIDVSQNSWGFGDTCADFGIYDHYTLGPEYDAIVNGVYGKRVSVVFAAGNQQDWCASGWDTVGAPATAKNVIAVGATNSNDKSMTSFSSWGPVNDGRMKPDVVAPGCEVGGEGAIWSTLPPNRYGAANWCGTSMAAPAVSGILGLLLEAYNATYGSDPWPSTLKAVLMHTALDLGNPGPDYKFGYGHVDALAGINLITATGDGNTSLNVRQDSVTNGQIKTYTLSSAGSSPLKCTLLWDDYPGTASSSKVLINDLDLRLIGPGGMTFLPWVLNKNSPGQAATAGDNNLDNVEQVVVTNPQAGQWMVQVIGDSVPLGPEAFSLICPFGAASTATATPTVTPTVCALPADVDGDGDVDEADVQFISASWHQSPPNPAHDLDGDGDVDVVDVVRVAGAQGGRCS